MSEQYDKEERALAESKAIVGLMEGKTRFLGTVAISVLFLAVLLGVGQCQKSYFSGRAELIRAEHEVPEPCK